MRNIATQSKFYHLELILYLHDFTFTRRTKTECEIKSKPITRKVCTHKYLQKQHNVPATNVEVHLDDFEWNKMFHIEQF